MNVPVLRTECKEIQSKYALRAADKNMVELAK